MATVLKIKLFSLMWISSHGPECVKSRSRMETKVKNTSFYITSQVITPSIAPGYSIWLLSSFGT